ncbi:glycosyltransferase family 2 protein [Solirubrum puertoriconensis]|uniref:Glycosyltransferase n=1 Tax=Solirubrum puertoriconensis TaxID=1751427 RepID=A0A9X0HP58_SOLP1|nr:glycosyltransferase family 2 protein [Solirubrum puertoriconensis]KUG09550.1 glycosyltransferase [Solirubrum puertoriconensis]
MPTPPEHPFISVVSPVYQAAAVLPELAERLVAELPHISGNYEIILVDDGSTDTSWTCIEELATRNPRIRGLRLSRNFGQHHAITAGLDIAQGTWIVVMDCDLQDRPEEISALYQQAQQGYDVVLAARQHRQDSWMKRASSSLFYRALSYLTGVKQNPAVANFGLYHQRVIDTVRQLRESIRYFPTMVRWAGFRQCSIPVQHLESKRPTTYNLGRRLRLATDIMLAYSDKPLRLTVYTGLLISVVAFLLGLITLIRFALGQITVPGYASLFIFMSFFSGLVILVLGIVGLYVGKTFEGVRNRPLYVVAATTPRNSHEADAHTL